MFANAKNPRWANKTHEQIILDVQFKDDEDYVSFTASPKDCTTHGPMLFNFAKNGVFGPVEDSREERILRGEIEPPEGQAVIDGKIVSLAALEREAQAELDKRLAALNAEEAKARAEIDEDYAAGRRAKLAALLAVKEQEGWPGEVEWPE